MSLFTFSVTPFFGRTCHTNGYDYLKSKFTLTLPANCDRLFLCYLQLVGCRKYTTKDLCVLCNNRNYSAASNELHIFLQFISGKLWQRKSPHTQIACRGSQLVHPTGIEPAASGVGVLRSIHMSYGCMQTAMPSFIL